MRLVPLAIVVAGKYGEGCDDRSMKVVLSAWDGDTTRSELISVLGDPTDRFLGAVAKSARKAGTWVDRGFRWELDEPSSMAAIIRVDVDGVRTPPIFIDSDISIQELENLVGSAAFTSPPSVTVSPNDGVGGDEFFQFVADIHQPVQVIAEIAGYLSAFRVIYTRVRRVRDRPIENEIRVSYLTHAISPELIAFFRERPEWTSSQIEKRFGLSMDSVSTLMPLCGFTAAIDKHEILWIRE